MSEITVINCGHWSSGGCQLGLWGGRPSLGTCGRCLHNPEHTGEGILPAPPEQQGLIHGAATAITTAIGIGRASYKTIKARESVCGSCPEMTSTLGVRQCGKCGCVYALKLATAAEGCPLGKWAAESVTEHDAVP